jgi:hypothetical protein
MEAVVVIYNNNNNYVRFEAFTTSKYSKIFSVHINAETNTIIRVETLTEMMETKKIFKTLTISSTLTWLIARENVSTNNIVTYPRFA